MPISKDNLAIGVIGLGYVGLPVAHAFAKKFNVIGFDVDGRRVDELKKGNDWTGEISAADLGKSPLKYTSDISQLHDCNFIVVAVPTPVDENRAPDFTLLKRACDTIGPIVKKDSIIVFESTVFPGATEEICGPALEASSGLKCGTDFKLAYSPERINPGDKQHPLEKIVKVVAGQDDETLEMVSFVYSEIIEAGVFRAKSIKVAEAAKVLENTQRDINIALMNEMSKICDRIGIRTAEVLEAAGTKWNFLPFSPGLVGGHCIGVDPYYLTSKAEQLGYHPEVILAGRRINDAMPEYVATKILKLLASSEKSLRKSRVGVLGITFKKNVPDIRNSKVVTLIEQLNSFGISVMVSDPMADPEETMRENGIELVPESDLNNLDVFLLAVPHDSFVVGVYDFIRRNLKSGGIIVDLHSVLDRGKLPEASTYWSL